MSKKSKNNSREMKQPEPIRKEIVGILFLLVSIILGVSLFSYHPADPLIWISTSDSIRSHNLFGTLGSHIAGGIFFLVGFSSLWLAIVFFAISVEAFRGRPLSSPVKGSLSILILVISFSGLINLYFNEVIFRGEEVISGGIIGIHVAAFMKDILNLFGATVLLTAVCIIALMISTHTSFGGIFSRMLLWLSGVKRRIRDIYTKRKEKIRKGRVRVESLKKQKDKQKLKVTIVEPIKERPKMPEQETFSFMKAEGDFKLPPLDLLEKPPENNMMEIQRESLEMNARRLERKLADFGVEGEVVEILPGPVITMYELKPAPGVKISKIAGLADDLTLALRAPSIRIVAPIPGKAAIGIEIANNKRDHVYLRDVLSSEVYQDSKNKLTIALGKDITGLPFVTDLVKMPHLLVAGATGTGKSVSLNAMINSLLFKLSPEQVRFLMIDPKRIELSIYRDIPHLLHPVVTEPKEATRALRWAVQEMERRYMLLSDRGVRNIDAFNRKLSSQKTRPGAEDQGTDRKLPYIILVIDELADLMMVSSREVEEAITRLAQMARAAGIHLIIATQRPSVDVLTGIIKANFPTRISFQVSSKVDSRTILDTIGAEHLLGEGDMLFMPPGVGRMIRIHGAYISEDEVKRVTDWLREQMKPDYDPTIVNQVVEDSEDIDDEFETDEKYEAAVDVVLKSGQASISMLQRKLRVGYNRAARMIELMEREGIVGPSDGVKGREVFGRKE